MVTSILFLCTGNTCRSPVAEVLARRQYGTLDLDFKSAGLDARPGQPASIESAAWAEASGLSLAGHCSQPVSTGILTDASWVIGMTRSHAAIFNSRFGDVYHGGIGVLGAACVDLSLLDHSPETEEVSDPYGGTADEYGPVCEQIARLLACWEPCFRGLAVRKELER